MEFTPIESQEQFDAMVKDRVERAKKSAQKEFETQLKDLESIKTQMAEKENELTELRQKITDLNGEKKTNEESYQSMLKELSTVKLDALKQKIAIEEGIPLEMANRLNGDDDESIRNDAKTIKGFMGSKTLPRSANNDDAPMDTAEAGYRAMAQIFGKD